MMKLVYRLTRSEHMALLDILVEQVHGGRSQTFVNCSENPPVETHVADLLIKFSNMDEWVSVEGDNVTSSVPRQERDCVS